MFNILIVDDNAAFRESLKEMLIDRFPSIVVHEASDGRETWRILENLLPDLIFLDIRLPDENGLEITRKIKQQHRHIPIIIATNYDLAEYREAARQYGADDFITKGSSSWDKIVAHVESLMRPALRESVLGLDQ
jgi:CheY-like chemotaxis protein